MIYVLDTNVLVAGIRSPAGASADILRRAIVGELAVAASVPLFLEYEAVLLRPEHLSAAQASAQDILNVLDVLAGVVKKVEIQFLWRPQLRDPNDDLVLELAVNALGWGLPVSIVSFNLKDFLPQADRFGVRVLTPRQLFQGA